MSNVNTLARALAFCCTQFDDNDEDQLSLLASDNPIHGNKWQDQKLARDTTRMLHSFCKHYAKLWWRSEPIDWHEVGMVLAGTGCGYDDRGQESLREVCQRICKAVWPCYADSAMWRLTKRGSLALAGTGRPKAV